MSLRRTYENELVMTLHPQAVAFIERVTEEGLPPLSTLPPTEARIWDEKITALLTKGSESIDRVEDRRVLGLAGDIPIRIYSPITRATPGFLLYFHGGGWVLGNVNQVDYPCRLLANKTGRIVVSVDYHLAPEHKFPVAPEDCYAVTKWVAENAKDLGGNNERLAVCGDSAGGNLAAAVSLMARDRAGPIIEAQILIYPVVDLLDSNYQDFPYDLSPALTKDDMLWFIGHYISKQDDLNNKYASPLLSDDLEGLPRTVLITVEYDILTKQCIAYATNLTKAGVQVHSTHYPGLIHGFFTLPDMFDAAVSSMEQIAEDLG
jgi:acetyl esterase